MFVLHLLQNIYICVCIHTLYIKFSMPNVIELYCPISVRCYPLSCWCVHMYVCMYVCMYGCMSVVLQLTCYTTCNTIRSVYQNDVACTLLVLCNML